VGNIRKGRPLHLPSWEGGPHWEALHKPGTHLHTVLIVNNVIITTIMISDTDFSITYVILIVITSAVVAVDVVIVMVQCVSSVLSATFCLWWLYEGSWLPRVIKTRRQGQGR